MSGMVRGRFDLNSQLGQGAVILNFHTVLGNGLEAAHNVFDGAGIDIDSTHH